MNENNEKIGGICNGCWHPDKPTRKYRIYYVESNDIAGAALCPDCVEQGWKSGAIRRMEEFPEAATTLLESFSCVLTTVEVLEAARERVAEGWNQGESALDGKGFPCSPCSPHAVSHCLLGGLETVWHRVGRGTREDALGWVVESIPNSEIRGLTVSEWNDLSWRTKDEVLAVLDRAIEGARRVRAR